ncbi:MAG: HAMP domain-containing histidine kinase, partial [Nitrospirota bacterium]|nr:HAMP domain-containing histidine kinase [Nitrospirota bacterium]
AIPETPVGGSVTIGGSVELDENTAVLTVADTGGGMSQEIRDKLFTKEGISGKAGGTGLGTKIVKDAVDAHAGTITVQSEKGKGTIFTIRLPISPTDSRT